MRYQVGLTIGIILAALAVFIAVSTSHTGTDFGIANAGWNGYNTLRGTGAFTSVSSLRLITTPPKDTVVLVIPTREFRAGEVDVLRKLLDQDGALVLADDFHYGNELLEALDIPYRFEETPLLDPISNHQGQQFPIVTDIEPSTLTFGVQTLALNYATAIRPEGLVILARSSRYGFLDGNNSGLQDPDEPAGRFPIVGYGPAGEGRIVLISDPSMFINRMLSRESNATLLANLGRIQGEQTKAFLYEGALPEDTLVRAQARIATAKRLASSSVMLYAVPIALVAIGLYPLWRRKRR